ncbi:MAG TPA: family 20 glycosylhydrolase [Mucilaginibacter sp.]
MMHKKAVILLFIFFIFFAAVVNAQGTDPNLGIVPAPVSLKKSPGVFTLSNETVFLADSLSDKAVNFLADYLQNTAMLSIKPKSNTGQAVNNSIVLTAAGADGLAPEGYRLTITPQNITIAAKGAGLFYGIQTLLQLMPLERTAFSKLPCVQIEDAPRFGYRGLMLDVARHFFPVAFIKKTIDLMSSYKLNNFHWHLTDDQGWRIEIKKYPKLTEIGSKRPETLIGNYHDRTPQQFDNTPYGGYYTQDQIRDVIKYAADRYINIVPEIEMPGHSDAALAAYPEYGCNLPNTYKVSGTWSEQHDVYCPTEETFGFLQDVLTEVMELFPGKYIHIGGDEVAKDDWQQSEFAQKLMKKLKLKDEHELQSYFIKRIEKFVNTKGKSVIGWDEILEGGLAPNATIMSWQGEAGGIAAARQAHNAIMTPSSAGLYLDHAQGKLENEPLGIGGYSPIRQTYAYNPMPAVLTEEQQKYIIGVQGNLWTEYIPTENKVEYMLLPRLLALAEVGWTLYANKNYTDFKDVRLPQRLAWLDKHDFDYRVPAVIGAKDTIIFGTQLTVDLKPSVTGAKVYYTIDGYPPRETDMEYTGPMTYNVPPDQYRELQAITITPTGKRSDITRTVVYNKAPLPPVVYQGTGIGLKYQLFTGPFNNTNQLNMAAPLDTAAMAVKSFNVNAFRRNSQAFGIIYNGFIRIDADGVYGFSTQSDDGSVLLIDDQPVVDNDGKHALYDKGGSVPLQKGFHRFTLKYFNVGASGNLRVFMTIPGKPKGELAPDILYN